MNSKIKMYDSMQQNKQIKKGKDITTRPAPELLSLNYCGTLNSLVE